LWGKKLKKLYLILPPHPSRGYQQKKTGKVSWLSRLRPPSHPPMANSGKIGLSAYPVTGIRITVAGQQRLFTAFPFPVLLTLVFFLTKEFDECLLFLAKSLDFFAYFSVSVK